MPPSPDRPRRRRPAGALVAVAVGGALGTLARAGTDQLLGSGRLPWSTVAVNLLGAFALGLLAEVLARTAPTSDRSDRLRLLVGTGLLGGLTTYSALAVQTAVLLPAQPLWAVGYAGGLVLLGLGAAALGAATGAVLTRRTAAPGRSGRP